MARIAVIVISDSTLFGRGLVQVLSEDRRLEVLGLARTEEEIHCQFAKHCPEVVLLDMSMPHALDIIHEIHAVEPQTKIVALGLSGETGILPCAEAGISGYLCRDGSLDDLVATVQGVVRGELRCSRRVAAALLYRVASLAHVREQVPKAHLTPREREITFHLDGGRTNKEIAQSLGIEVGTVKNHVHNILEKLGATTRGEAAAKARELHIIPRLSSRPARLQQSYSELLQSSA